jgi:hypothetical protein
MTRTCNRLSHPFVLLVGLSVASIAWAQAQALVEGKAAPPRSRSNPPVGQHPWDVTCVCERALVWDHCGKKLIVKISPKQR